MNIVHRLSWCSIQVTDVRVCFAVFESGGNSADDFVMLDVPLEQAQPAVYTPRRTVLGAPQNLQVSG